VPHAAVSDMAAVSQYSSLELKQVIDKSSLASITENYDDLLEEFQYRYDDVVDITEAGRLQNDNNSSCGREFIKQFIILRLRLRYL